MSLNIAFHSNQICLQGTEVAVFDYADFNETLLGNKSIILSKDNPLRTYGGAGKNQPLALEKFRKRFPVILYKDVSEIEGILKENNIDILYAQKKGIPDGVESKNVRTVIHTVFKYYEPHGDVYAYISKWLADVMTQGKSPHVPYMINMPSVQGDLREELNIPSDAVVFGRYGGTNSFDIDFVHKTVEEYAEKHPDVYFIFMNTDDFLNPTDSITAKFKSLFRKKTLPNIKFLEGTSEMNRKAQFINTCTAMLHARFRGETFGLAVAEFSILNKPVMTYGGAGEKSFESNHIEILGDKGLVYNSAGELTELLDEIRTNPNALNKDWDAYSANYSPAAVMQTFKKIFIDS